MYLSKNVLLPDLSWLEIASTQTYSKTYTDIYRERHLNIYVNYTYIRTERLRSHHEAMNKEKRRCVLKTYRAESVFGTCLRVHRSTTTYLPICLASYLSFHGSVRPSNQCPSIITSIHFHFDSVWVCYPCPSLGPSVLVKPSPPLPCIHVRTAPHLSTAPAPVTWNTKMDVRDRPN